MDESAILSFIADLKASRKNPLLGDDIGMLPWRGRTFAATDSLIENTHYRSAWLSPEGIAYKLFARNWSDFICKGIRPAAALLNFALKKRPPAEAKQFVQKFLRALDLLFTKHGIILIGGDVARAECDYFTLSFFGSHGNFLPRRAKNLRADALVLQLGAVGASDAARAVLEKNPTDRSVLSRGFRKPHLFTALPQTHRLLSTIDQSDSVHKSLCLLAKENCAELEIELSKLIIAPPFRRLVGGAIERLPSAAEDLAIFALGYPISRAGAQQSAAAFRPVGKIKTIRTKKPCVRYFWRGRPLVVQVHEFEHL